MAGKERKIEKLARPEDERKTNTITVIKKEWIVLEGKRKKKTTTE